MKDPIINCFNNFKETLKDFQKDNINDKELLNHFILHLIYKFSLKLGIENKNIKRFISFLDNLGFEKKYDLESIFVYLSTKENINEILSTFDVSPREFGRFIGTTYGDLQSLILKKAGGCFYTPDEIIKYLITRVIDENLIIRDPYVKILDPACGSGFFLYSVYDHLANIYLKNIDLINNLHPEMKLLKENIGIHIITHNLFGMDIDLMGVLITKIGLLEKCNFQDNNKFDILNVICCDSLFHPTNEKFDIVIGNPPWVSFGIRDLGKINKEERERFKKEFAFSSQYKISYYSLFIEKGIKALKNGGKLAFITPDSYLLGHYFTNLRKYILSQGYVKEITMLGKSIFRGVNAGYEALLIFEKDVVDKDNKVTKHKNKIVAQWANNIQSLIDCNTKRYTYSQELFYNNDKLRFYLCFDEQSFEIINIFKGIKEKFQDSFGFYSGCIGRYGQKSIISYDKISKLIIRDKQDNIIWQDDNPQDYWRPLIESGSNIRPFYISPSKANVYIHPEKNVRRIYGKSGFKTNIYQEPKLLLRQTGDKLIAAYDDGGLFTLNNIHLLYSLKGRKEDLFYVLGLLNSNLYNYYYQVISMEKGRMMSQIDLDVIKELPLIMGTEEQKKELKVLVNKIIELYKNKDKYKADQINKKSKEYKNNINHLVYNMANVGIKLRDFIEKSLRD